MFPLRLMVAMNKVLPGVPVCPEGTEWKEGDTCALQYNKDDKWYRGRVVSVDDKVKVGHDRAMEMFS